METNNEEMEKEVVAENNTMEENTSNEQNVDNNIEENNNNSASSDTEKKSKAPLIIVAVVVLIVLGVIIFGIASLFGNKAAAKGKKFLKLATSDQKILELVSFEKAENGQTNVNSTIDIDDIAVKMGAEEKPGVGTFKFDSKQIVENEDYSSKSQFSLGNINMELQIAKTGDIVGINVPGITEKFIGINFGDTEGLVNNLKELGILAETENDDMPKYTEEQTQDLIDLAKKYFGVVVENMGDFIVETSNVTVSAHNKSDVAKEYVFTLNGESCTKIGVAVEKELLKNKKDIEKLAELGFVENVDDAIAELESSINDNEEIIKNGNYEGVIEQNIVIKLYEKKGKNIGTVLEMDDIKMAFYVFENSKDNFETVFVTTSEGVDTVTYVITEKLDDSKTQSTIGTVYNGNDVTITSINSEKVQQADEEIITISEDNTLLLNTASKEELQEYGNKVSENFQSYIVRILLGQQ